MLKRDLEALYVACLVYGVLSFGYALAILNGPRLIGHDCEGPSKQGDTKWLTS